MNKSFFNSNALNP